MIRFSSCMAPNMESMCRDIARLAAERLGVATSFVGDVDWQVREERFMRGAIDPGLRSAIGDLLLTLHEDAEGRAVLDGCRIERFVRVGDDHYDPIRRMAADAAGVVL